MDRNKKGKKRGLIAFLILMAVLFVIIFAWSSVRTYRKSIENENLGDMDFYSMQKYSSENSASVMEMLKSGNMKDFSKLLGDEEGAESVMSYADWRSADFDSAVSFGAGSLSKEADKRGRIEIAEKFVVKAGKTKYVLYIETLTSRWGRKNEGVKAVGVTTYDHYEDLDANWNGEKDEDTALGGRLFRDKDSKEKKDEQQASE